MSESTLKQNTAAVRRLFGTAAKLAQNQAALATLSNVTLPKLYHAIGKKIVGLEKLPPDLVPHREKIRAFEAGIATKPEELPAAPAEGFAAKAKHFAQQAAQKASKATADATAAMQIQAAYVALGEEAVEKYGEKAIPKDLQAEVTATHERKLLLESELATLSGGNMRRVALPARLGWIAVALYGVSWFLPASGAGLFSLSGWEAFRAGLNGGVLFKISALTNVIACAGIALLFGWHRDSAAARHFLRALLALSFLWNLPFLLGSIGIGYLVWMAAFGCLFMAIGKRPQQTPEAVNMPAARAVSRDMFALARVMAVAAVSLVSVNSAVGFLTAAGVSGESGSASVASSPPTTTARRDSDEKTSNVGVARVWLEAIHAAHLLKQAEEQRVQRQVQQRPQRLCPHCEGSGYSDPYSGRVGDSNGVVCGMCGGRGTMNVGAKVQLW